MAPLKTIALGTVLLVCPGLVLAALPAPTPAAAQAAAAKKAQAQAQSDKEKQALLASMDTISARWRARATAQGWQVHAPVPVAAPVAAVGQPAAQSSSSGQPGGRMGAAASDAPVRSEKSGTAPPSADVKKAPSGTQLR
jgi:hypothetical protein